MKFAYYKDILKNILDDSQSNVWNEKKGKENLIEKYITKDITKHGLYRSIQICMSNFDLI